MKAHPTFWKLGLCMEEMYNKMNDIIFADEVFGDLTSWSVVQFARELPCEQLAIKDKILLLYFMALYFEGSEEV